MSMSMVDYASGLCNHYSEVSAGDFCLANAYVRT